MNSMDLCHFTHYYHFREVQAGGEVRTTESNIAENRSEWFEISVTPACCASIMEGGQESEYQRAWDEWNVRRVEES